MKILHIFTKVEKRKVDQFDVDIQGDKINWTLNYWFTVDYHDITQQ